MNRWMSVQHFVRAMLQSDSDCSKATAGYITITISWGLPNISQNSNECSFEPWAYCLVLVHGIFQQCLPLLWAQTFGKIITVLAAKSYHVSHVGLLAEKCPQLSILVMFKQVCYWGGNQSWGTIWLDKSICFSVTWVERIVQAKQLFRLAMTGG